MDHKNSLLGGCLFTSARGMVAVASLMGMAAPCAHATVTTFTDGVILGSSNTVNAESLAVGDNNIVNGGGSIVMGGGNSIDNASSYMAVFGGGHEIYGGSNAIVGGSDVTLTNSSCSYIFGYEATMENQLAAFAAGGGNRVKSLADYVVAGNIVLGHDNEINTGVLPQDTLGSVLIGLSNYTTQGEAWAFGRGNIAQTHTVTLGTYNQTVANASLIVGNGSFDDVNGIATRSNAMVVLKNGTVQIPSGNLQLGSESALTPTGATSLISSHLSTNGYVRKAMGTNAVVSNGGLLALGASSQATATGAISLSGQAVGVESLALNRGRAEGMYSTALNGGVSVGPSSIAMGNATYAMGDHSFAVGNYSTASGPYSYVIGENANADGDHALAIGGNASANGDYASALGNNSYANGDLATAVGSGACAEAASSIAIGSVTYASAEHSSAMGFGLVSNAYAEFVVGTYNREPQETVNANAWVETERAFVVGNGADFENRSNAIITLKNGRTALTNKHWVSSSPTGVPVSTDASSGEALVVEGHTVLKGNTRLSGKVTMDEPQGDISMGIYQ